MARRIGAINTMRVDRRTLAGRQHRRRRISAAAAGSRLALPRPARVDSRRRRRGAGRGGRAGSRRGAAVHGPRAQPARGPKTWRCWRPATVGPWPPEPGSWDLLVNCTPIGMYPHVTDTPVPPDALTGALVYDLSTTRRRRGCCGTRPRPGCQTIGGLDMLVGAGARAVPLVDGPAAAARSHAGGGGAPAGGVHGR